MFGDDDININSRGLNYSLFKFEDIFMQYK